MYDSAMPQHTVRNLPPFTNVSLKLVLSNPDGRKESEELLMLTDEDGTSWELAVISHRVAEGFSMFRLSLQFPEPFQ